MLSDVEEAVEHLGAVCDLAAWKIEFIISTCRLILENNFIESSSGIFKLKPCLPMGMTASPICLDIVGLSSEVKKLSNPIQSLPSPSCSISKLLQSNQIVVRCEILKDYMRYQDDTNALLSSTDKERIISIIVHISTRRRRQLHFI